MIDEKSDESTTSITKQDSMVIDVPEAPIVIYEDEPDKEVKEDVCHCCSFIFTFCCLVQFCWCANLCEKQR